MPSTAPTVSVLLPVRDALPHLAEATRSVSAQTLEDFEVIAVDDGSTDGSADHLAAWAAMDRRVRLVGQGPLGIVPALERARSFGRGRYLARMDADDVALPGRLAAQRALMEADPAMVACGTGVEYFPSGTVRDGARRYERWINAAVTPEQIERALFVECPLPHPTFFLRADAVAAAGGYRDAGWPEDYDLILRLWAAGGRLGKVPEVLLRWREGPDRLSRTDRRYTPRAFRACKAHHLMSTHLRDRPGAVIWGAGPVGKALARSLLSAGGRVLAFVDLDPRKIGQEIHGAPVLDTDAGLARHGPLHLLAVGQRGARARLVGLLRDAGHTELVDFVAVA